MKKMKILTTKELLDPQSCFAFLFGGTGSFWNVSLSLDNVDPLGELLSPS